MASSRRPLTLFPNLNDSLIEIANINSSEPQQNASALAPVFSFPTMSVEQLMAVQCDIYANHYTLKSCVEIVNAVSNLSRRLQNRTNELHLLTWGLPTRFK
ncbi:hypothetical protein ACSBR1_012425 [Camellia fascicularis]